MLVGKTTVTFNDDSTYEVYKGTTIYELSKIYQPKMKYRIVGAEIDNETVSMYTPINKATKINFIDMTTTNGYKINKYGLEFVLEVALKEALGKDYEVTYNHSIANGIHMTILSEKKFTLADAKKLKTMMNEIINNDEPITILNVETKEAIAYYNKVKAPEKARNLHNITNNILTLYKLRNYINYFYSEMPYSTGCLKEYDLVYLGNNRLVLLFPSPHTKFQVPEYIHYQNVIKNFEENNQWEAKLGIPYVADINDLVSNSKIEDFIKIVESHLTYGIHELIDDVVKKKSRFVLLAGPSSSGKTTTTKKIALQFRSRGYETLVLSADDYYKDHNELKPDSEGKYDYEALSALDVKLLNKQLKELVSGKKVYLPTYNFTKGKKEFSTTATKLGENGIILLEGLHSLNDEMTSELPAEEKYKIYLSPFISLNVDRHNYISSTDLRLIRRIVRDNRTRNTDVGRTIEYWNTVRRGEEKYIYPYINDVDIILNTSLVYEVGVLKVFVEPLLYSVKSNSPAYNEARRLINSLKNFFPIPSDYVPDESILREFIGKSSFENYK